MSTHTPYRLLRGVEREIVAEPRNMADDYYNNMRYLDNRLREYVGSLSSATVVIYSDHPADSALEPDFQPDGEGRLARVPCFIFDTDSDLGAQQRTRDDAIAVDGNLGLLDVSTFLRTQIAARTGQRDLESPQPAVGG